MNWQKYVQVASLVAIPFVVGVGGFVSDHYLQEATLKRDYVQIAVQILQNPNKQDPGLREWAVDLINSYADVDLEPEVANRLKKGDVLWPAETNKRLLSELELALKDISRHQRGAWLGYPLPRGKSESLVSLLAELLTHEDEQIRSTAAACLKEIGTPGAVEALNKQKK